MDAESRARSTRAKRQQGDKHQRRATRLGVELTRKEVEENKKKKNCIVVPSGRVGYCLLGPGFRLVRQESASSLCAAAWVIIYERSVARIAS